ncbi:MAG: response regulator transcription factor [Chloroflexi bacterium]|nr:response regulator transcription factor [Chloroflexota bacterium]
MQTMNAKKTATTSAKHMNKLQLCHITDDFTDGNKPQTQETSIYVVEEQELLRYAYEAILLTESDIKLVGVSANGKPENLLEAVSNLQPDTILVGTKTLESSTIAQLIEIRHHFPGIGIVLLAAHYDHTVVKQLRALTSTGHNGCALLLKRSLNRIDQLTQAIHAVANGQVILDPVVMEGLVVNMDDEISPLKQLTRREIEVLGLVAKGYRNTTIADILFVEPNTVERHINSIYNKLSDVIGSKNPRVGCTVIYLKATSQFLDPQPAID